MDAQANNEREDAVQDYLNSSHMELADDIVEDENIVVLDQNVQEDGNFRDLDYDDAPISDCGPTQHFLLESTAYRAKLYSLNQHGSWEDIGTG